MPLLRDLIYLLFALVSSPIWLIRLLVTGKWRTDWPSRFGHCKIVNPDHRPVVLIHAVSVGEVNGIRLLVDRLHEKSNGQLRVVVSVTTDTGLARARQLFEPAHHVVRYPLDFSFAVNAFLNEVKPSFVVLMELEVWPGFISTCSRRNIPVSVVNGRLSARSFKRYKLIQPLLRSTFAKLVFAGVQTPDYAARFIAMGVPKDRVHVTDTMKWDTAQLTDTVPGSDVLAKAMGIDLARPIIVAGSTAPGEDQLLIDTCPPEAQLILVPRKPEWFDAVAKLAPRIVRRTAHPDGTVRPLDAQRLFLLNTVGELRKAYAFATVVIVGRSFLGLYGSDMMEPVGLGKPTMIGPFNSDFTDTVNALLQGDGLIVTDKPGQVAKDLLADPARAKTLATNGRQVILSRQGATERNADLILNAMSPRS